MDCFWGEKSGATDTGDIEKVSSGLQVDYIRGITSGQEELLYHLTSSES